MKSKYFFAIMTATVLFGQHSMAAWRCVKTVKECNYGRTVCNNYSQVDYYTFGSTNPSKCSGDAINYIWTKCSQVDTTGARGDAMAYWTAEPTAPNSGGYHSGYSGWVGCSKL